MPTDKICPLMSYKTDAKLPVYCAGEGCALWSKAATLDPRDPRFGEKEGACGLKVTP